MPARAGAIRFLLTGSGLTGSGEAGGGGRAMVRLKLVRCNMM
jgi:hypothetical protein